MGTQDETCEGFANYETAQIALWIDNTESLYDFVRENIGKYADPGHWLREKVIVTLYPDDGIGDPMPASKRDVIDYRKAIGSIWRVDWRELAEHFTPEEIDEPKPGFHVSAIFISNDDGERWTDLVDIDVETLDVAEKAANFYQRHNRRAQNGHYRHGNYRRVQIRDNSDGENVATPRYGDGEADQSALTGGHFEVKP